MPSLDELGWDAGWSDAFESFRAAGFEPGRVAAPHRGGAYDVIAAGGESRAHLPGRVRHAAPTTGELPVVGDWVALDRARSEGPMIQAVLPRRTKLSRRAAHDPRAEAVREQVVAANVDIVLITASLADDLNPRLLERYLTLAWESGARPAILLTKADLEPDPERVAAEVADVGGTVPVVAVSTRAGVGLERVRALIPSGVTGALLGPSGVGKSTLVNALAGEDLLATASLRADGSGRHTTTHRQLVVLPGGGIVVDNPGIRELHLWVADEGLEEAFADILELATQCRFSDCRHETEPGCAVQAALAAGTLTPERWRGYRELEQELAELERRLARRGRPRGARRGSSEMGAE